MAFTPKLDWADSPATTTPVTAAELTRIETGIRDTSLVADAAVTDAELAAVAAVASEVRHVMVVTGSEPRPAGAGLVIWVSPAGVSPANAAATDLIAMPQPDTTPPAVPGGLASSGVGDTGFTMSWSASTDDVAVTGYEVRVNNGTAVAVAASPQSYAWTGLTVGTLYAAQVRARDAAGNWSGWSAALNVTTTGGAIFADSFNRANGQADNGWTGPSGASNCNIVGNACAFSGWGGYNRAGQSGLPRNVSVRAVFVSTIDSFQGIFLGHSASSGTGLRLFNNGDGTWAIGNTAGFNANNTNFAEPSGSRTTLRLDCDGTNVRAYIDGTLRATVAVASLGFSLDSAGGNVYQAGYCGEAKAPNLDSFEVWTA